MCRETLKWWKSVLPLEAQLSAALGDTAQCCPWRYSSVLPLEAQLSAALGGTAQGRRCTQQSQGHRTRTHLDCQLVFLVLETILSDDTSQSTGGSDRVMH